VPVLQLARLAVYGPYNLSLPLTLPLIMVLPILPPLWASVSRTLPLPLRLWAHVKGKAR
jgi:hypothetical protein